MKPLAKKQLLCTMDKEIWEHIKGYPNYEVSNYGNIRRWCYSKNKYRYLKPRRTGIELHRTINGIKEEEVVQLSQLVADAFCKRFSASRDCVIHIDGNVLNNQADNLLWVNIEDANICNRWRHIAIGDERYQVNNIGKVRSINIDDNGRIITKEIPGSITSSGYATVAIRKNGKTIKQPIHRLVAMAFLPNPDNKSFVYHKDRNTLNNRVTNLQWVTPSEHSTLHKGEALKKKEDVRELLKEFKSSKL